MRIDLLASSNESIVGTKKMIGQYIYRVMENQGERQMKVVYRSRNEYCRIYTRRIQRASCEFNDSLDVLVFIEKKDSWSIPF